MNIPFVKDANNNNKKTTTFELFKYVFFLFFFKGGVKEAKKFWGLEFSVAENIPSSAIVLSFFLGFMCLRD